MVRVMTKMGTYLRHSWKYTLFWAAAVMHVAMFTTADNATAPENTELLKTEGDGWSWSTWSSWTPCSRTCGGGVSMQSRQCLPRRRLTGSNTSVSNSYFTSSSTTTLVRNVVTGGECLGSARRYHECNTAPCSGGSATDMRSEQCANYDRRPFRGRYYNWVPYVDGDSPCTLNCRPLGKHFYASLALVADGTPCTKPGFRAICVQGVCKVVGREGVLSASAGGGGREARCGRRLVSGLFSRPRLPLGYSYVTTVPRGACRLNVSEMIPSDNYIALKLSNASYIMNGEFAVSTPGSYDAAGARFQYTRVADLDIVYAHGPIQHPVDIMILYTQPNPSIKYEYFTDSLPGELDVEIGGKAMDDTETPSTIPPKHIRRHHGFRSHPRVFDSAPRYPETDDISKESSDEEVINNFVGSRKFLWKITSFTQCSRTCGGGIQIGKYRCVESSANGSDREVSPVHCLGSPPASRRKRCGIGQCPPRWRTAAWSDCPKCGPATRTRIVGCVQDHSKGITKVSDQKCPPSKPETVQTCDVPDCDDHYNEDLNYKEQIDSKRNIRPRIQTDTFRDGPVYTISVNSSNNDIGPEYSYSSAGGWLYTEWSECVGWCVGGGIQTRGVRCADPAGCAPRRSPDITKSCNPQSTCEPYNGQWFTGEWSNCSSSCGGKRVRGVLCIGGSGRHLRDSACKGPRPDHEENCGDECLPTWYLSDWGHCTGHCEEGLEHRTLWCARGNNGVPSDECSDPKPIVQRACKPERCNSVTSAATTPELSIESQRLGRNEVTEQESTTVKEKIPIGCIDKLSNCALAVQARLCHYKYYTNNCCNSCGGI